MSPYRKIVACIILAGIIGSSGCFPTGETAVTGSGSETASTNSDSENIIYSFDIEDRISSEVPIYTAERMIWDESTVNALFGIKEGQNYKKELHEKSNYIPEMDYYNLYHFENDTIVCYDAGSLMYNSSSAEKYSIFPSFYGTLISNEIMRENFPKTSLPSFSSETAEKEMQKIISDLKINVGSPEIYAIDKETAENLGCGEHYDRDLYMLIYSQQAGGVPLPNFSCHYEESGILTVPFKVEAIFSENGLERFNCQFALNIKNETESVEICSGEAAAEAVKSRYESMALENVDEVITISGGSLIYLPENDGAELVLKPKWVFVKKTETTSEVPMVFYDEILVDAQTGMIQL